MEDQPALGGVAFAVAELLADWLMNMLFVGIHR